MGASNFLRRYTELPFLIDFLATGELFLPSPRTWDDRNDSYYLEKYSKLCGLEDVYALCLTEAPETYHHWKIFSSGTSGVCIVFDREKFVSEVEKIDDLTVGPVQYKTIKEMRGALIQREDLPFLKRYPYRDECELRLFSGPKRSIQNGLRVAIPKNTISQISLSPWLPKSVVSEIKQLLKGIKGCSRIKIYASTLVENDQWKNLSVNVK
ncbi:hypothetical protein [Pseudidiomarina terrestris]|uniref:hypothetical protein n=1 Tax=Pseudidiomarina terrestris TaxID=2820060 RepID=UPI002651A9DA|nr:hypothetical protein [Pseudidiomarina sp. 1ASP75-5]MDN7136020.1 hypothetical protein [Pseudidiomarina sp. 1ASP75-5]